MRLLAEFWRQPNKDHRNFQLVYAFHTLNFLLPSIGYALDPGGAIRQFELLGRILGAPSYPFAAGELGYVWRVLGAGNVMTLGVMCALLQWDLRRFYPVLGPLLFLKSYSSVGYGIVFLKTHYPAFLAVSLWDALAVLLMYVFATRAHRTLAPPNLGLSPC